MGIVLLFNGFESSHRGVKLCAQTHTALPYGGWLQYIYNICTIVGLCPKVPISVWGYALLVVGFGACMSIGIIHLAINQPYACVLY